jgi:hypothetical protein
LYSSTVKGDEGDMQGRKPFPFLACGLLYTFIRAAGIVKRNALFFSSLLFYIIVDEQPEIYIFAETKRTKPKVSG